MIGTGLRVYLLYKEYNMKTLKISGFVMLAVLLSFLQAAAQTPKKDTMPKPPDTLHRVAPATPKKDVPARPPATIDTVYNKKLPGQPPPMRPDTAGDRPKMKKT